MMDKPIDVALAWQRASNHGDREQLMALSAEDIALVGPRGATRGRDEVLAWLDRAGLHLRTLRLFARDGRVVVEQAGRWRDPATGEFGDEQHLATFFAVAGGRVIALARRDNLLDALVAGELRLADEVPLPAAERLAE